MLLYRWRNGIPENRDPGPQRDPTKTGKPGPCKNRKTGTQNPRKTGTLLLLLPLLFFVMITLFSVDFHITIAI